MYKTFMDLMPNKEERELILKEFDETYERSDKE